MKRVFILIAVIIALTAIMFSGCKKDTVDTSDPYYPIEISVYHGGGHPQPSANNPIALYLQEKLNVTFKWDILVGDSSQKRGTMIASGDYPDVIHIGESTWMDAGALIPLDDLVSQYGPRVRNLFGNTWSKMRYEDGKVYYLVSYGILQGRDQSPDYNGSGFWVQKEVLKDAGYPNIVTVDQFFDMIADYYRRNPTIDGLPTIPFTVLTHDWRVFELWNPPNFLAGNPNEGNGMVDPVTYEYKTFFTMDISRRWYQFLNQMNSRGLVDRAAFTDNYDQYSSKIAAGRVLGQFVQGWQFMYEADAANRDRGAYNRTMAPLPVVFDANITPRYRDSGIPNLLRGMGISVKAKDPARIMRFLNDFLSEDVQRTITWGIEGQHWQYNASRVPYRTPDQRNNWDNQNWQEQNRLLLLQDPFPKWEGTYSDGYPADLSHYYPEREAMLRPEDIELFSAYGVTAYNELMDRNPLPNNPWYPTWNMANPPDGSPAQIALQRCENTMRQRLPQIILAPPADFSRLWDSYVAEMNSNGIATYEQYMQEQLNQRLKDWGIR